MNNVTFGLNDIVEMKKPHPCGTNRLASGPFRRRYQD